MTTAIATQPTTKPEVETTTEATATVKPKAICQYLRKKNRTRKGFLLAQKVNDKEVKVTWSLCHLSLDDFNPEFARHLTTARIAKGHAPPVPESIKEDFEVFVERTKKYFKNSAVVIVADENSPIFVYSCTVTDRVSGKESRQKIAAGSKKDVELICESKGCYVYGIRRIR